MPYLKAPQNVVLSYLSLSLSITIFFAKSLSPYAIVMSFNFEKSTEVRISILFWYKYNARYVITHLLAIYLMLCSTTIDTCIHSHSHSHSANNRYLSFCSVPVCVPHNTTLHYYIQHYMITAYIIARCLLPCVLQYLIYIYNVSLTTNYLLLTKTGTLQWPYYTVSRYLFAI